MRIHVLHHASCFDGAVSSAVFAHFARRHFGRDVSVDYRPRDHAPGNPYQQGDFDADEVAVLDFRYSSSDRITWFFDHHVTAFQLPGEREHFEARTDGVLHHDPKAPSCAHLVARTLRATHQADFSGLEEILHWADIIDTARFASAEQAVSLDVPALQLMTFAERNNDPEAVARFVEDLQTKSMETLAAAGYVRDVVGPARAAQEADLALVGQRCHRSGDVVTVDLSDQPPRSYNKFLAYYHHPDVRYVVSLAVGPRGRLRLSVGYNPWLPAEERRHDIAKLCEAYGGGGHPFVGGASFARSARARAVVAQHQLAKILREQAVA